MERPKLSVIICTYNRVKLIPRALDSVMGQRTGFPFEVIVGDDFSTDGTRDFLLRYHESHPQNLVLSFLPQNSGLGVNWATALMKAQGELIAFLDDDDYWTDSKRMQTMVDYLDAHPETGLLYTNGYEMDERSGKRRLITYPEANYPDIHEMWNGRQHCIQLNMMMVRKTLLDDCVRLEDYIRLRFPIQDWSTNILLLKKARCAYLDMPTCVLSVNDGSLSRPKLYEQVREKYKKEALMCQYLADQFPDDPAISFSETDYQRYVNHILATLAFKRGEYRKAKEFTKLSGGRSFRDRCTRTWLTFQLYRLARGIRQKFIF